MFSANTKLYYLKKDVRGRLTVIDGATTFSVAFGMSEENNSFGNFNNYDATSAFNLRGYDDLF